MRETRDLSVVLDDWMVEGPAHAPDRLVARVLTETGVMPQKRGWPWIFGEQERSGQLLRFAVAAVFVLAVSASVVVLLTQGFGVNRPPVGGPSPSLTGPPLQTTSPSPAAQNIVLGESYTLPDFLPRTTVNGLVGWRLVAPATAPPERGSITRVVLEAPNGTLVTLIRPAYAIEETGVLIDVPVHLDSWLWSRGELLMDKTTVVVDMPPGIRVDDWSGYNMHGIVPENVQPNSHGDVVVLCGADSACSIESQDQFSIPVNDRFRMIVLNIEGTQVVIGTSAARDAWAPADEALTQLLGAVDFTP